MLNLAVIGCSMRYCVERRKMMTEVKYPWVVVVVGDGYAVARNGKDGTPDVTNYYAE